MAEARAGREAMPGRSALGAWVRDRRTGRRMSQKALAESARISRSYLCDIEHGRGTQPSLHVLQSIARALDEDPAELVMQASTDIDRGLALSPGSQRERRVLTIFRGLSPDAQAMVERFARFLHNDEQRFVQPQLTPFNSTSRSTKSSPERPLISD